MDVDMIFANNSFQYANLFYFANLQDKFPAPFLNISFEYMIAVLGYPHYMTG